MRTNQMRAAWELCRQGYPTLADEAEDRWRAGQPYQLDSHTQAPRALWLLIDQCNYEVAVFRNSGPASSRPRPPVLRRTPTGAHSARAGIGAAARGPDRAPPPGVVRSRDRSTLS
jgi:hypothetical protein